MSLALLVQSTQPIPHDVANVASIHVPGAPAQQKPLTQSLFVVQLAGVATGVSVSFDVGVDVHVGVEVVVSVGVLDGVFVGVGVVVGVAVGGTDGRARTIAFTNASTVLPTATASPTVAQPPLPSAFWKVLKNDTPAFVRHR